MIDSIQSFGDSFLFGSDLSDCKDKIGQENEHSQVTWPSLIAKELNLKYHCFAQPGRGNQSIAFTIFRLAKKTSLNIINWTWIDRYDYHFIQGSWPNTMRPTNIDANSEYYYKNIHNELDDKLRNQNIIYSVIQYLKINNIPFVMTYMDKLLLDKTLIGLENITSEILDNLRTFPNDQTFLEWSRNNGYTESEGWHPLEQAHEKAAEYWRPIYEKVINTHITTTKD